MSYTQINGMRSARYPLQGVGCCGCNQPSLGGDFVTSWAVDPPGTIIWTNGGSVATPVANVVFSLRNQVIGFSAASAALGVGLGWWLGRRK